MRIKIIISLLVCAAAASASTITSGTYGSGLISAASVSDGMTATMLDGSLVSGIYAGGTFSCVFAGNSCNGPGLIRLTVGAGGSDIGGSGTVWTITNLAQGNLTSLSITLANAAFNPCFSAGSISTDAGGCASAAAGAGNGRSVSGTDPFDPFSQGTTAASAGVVYSNMVQIGGIASNELYNQVTLTFSSGFSHGETFTFFADADQLGGVSVLNPEPATFGLVGAVLGGLAWRLRRRKTA